jgi:hypothetical protein
MQIFEAGKVYDTYFALRLTVNTIFFVFYAHGFPWNAVLNVYFPCIFVIFAATLFIIKVKNIFAHSSFLAAIVKNALEIGKFRNFSGCRKASIHSYWKPKWLTNSSITRIIELFLSDVSFCKITFLQTFAGNSVKSAPKHLSRAIINAFFQ